MTSTKGQDGSALVMIEYQREWLGEDGKLAGTLTDKAAVDAMVEASGRLLEAARQGGATVVHVGYRFAPGHPEVGDRPQGINRMNKEFATFTGPGADFVEPFVPRPGELEAAGRIGVSAFAGSNLDQLLRNQRIATVYLAGFTLAACVESTLRQAHDLGYEVVVVGDATAAFSPEQKGYVLESVVPQFGQSATVNKVVSALSRAAT